MSDKEPSALLVGMQRSIANLEMQVRREERRFVLASIRDMLPNDPKLDSWLVHRVIDNVESLPYARHLKNVPIDEEVTLDDVPKEPR